MTLAAIVVALGVAGLAAIGAVAVAVARNRGRRNRVVPNVPTNAPAEWAGTHTPLARLHRRLRAAVDGARAVPDPDGALIRARHEIEQAALAVDDQLVALHGMAERERAGRMADAEAAVHAVEAAAARLADAAATSRSSALPAVEAALERARLVEEAWAELDAEDVTTSPPAPPTSAASDEAARPQEDEDGPPRPEPTTG